MSVRTPPQGPAPDPKHRGCSAEDSDGDGVPDTLDRCVEVPAGLNPDTAQPGCPLPDRDHDSVPDKTDACPTTAGAPSRDPRTNGCPSLLVIRGGLLEPLNPIRFISGTPAIAKKSLKALRAMADSLNAKPEVRIIELAGFAEDREPKDKSLLAVRRLQNVTRFLIEHGVAPARLQSKVYRVQLLPKGLVAFRIVDPPLASPLHNARGIP